jgi:DNA-binding IclR family transcriptional regulator
MTCTGGQEETTQARTGGITRPIMVAHGTTALAEPRGAVPHRARKRDSMLTRGLAILNAFRAGETELSLSELARRVGLPKPTAHRLVAELLDSGFLERGQRGLLLGRQMFVLGTRLHRDQKIRVLALPHLQRLRKATGAAAYLSVAHGREVIHLVRVGVVGAADDSWEKVVGLGARRALSQTAGPVVRVEDVTQSRLVLACPVGLPGTGVVAAVSVACAATRDSRRAVAPEVHRTACELAASLSALPEFQAAAADPTADVGGAA